MTFSKSGAIYLDSSVRLLRVDRMAGSRLEKIGSIFSRMQGLLRSGAVKDIDKPLWYEIYQAFPPQQSPEYGRPEPLQPVRNILYAEDMIRAQFYKVYGNADVVDLQNEKVKTTCQKFIEQYMKFLSAGKPKADIFHLTSEALRSEGIRLRTLDDIRKEQEKQAPPAPIVSQAETISTKELFGKLAEKEAAEMQEFVDPSSDDHNR